MLKLLDKWLGWIIVAAVVVWLMSRGFITSNNIDHAVDKAAEVLKHDRPLTTKN